MKARGFEPLSRGLIPRVLPLNYTVTIWYPRWGSNPHNSPGLNRFPLPRLGYSGIIVFRNPAKFLLDEFSPNRLPFDLPSISYLRWTKSQVHKLGHEIYHTLLSYIILYLIWVQVVYVCLEGDSTWNPKGLIGPTSGILAHSVGFEPTTFWLTAKCSASWATSEHLILDKSGWIRTNVYKTPATRILTYRLFWYPSRGSNPDNSPSLNRFPLPSWGRWALKICFLKFEHQSLSISEK